MKQPPKTIDEGARRLFAGECFERNGNRIFYDPDHQDCPFRFAGEPLTGSWLYFAEWQPIPEWHESLSPENKRLCWLSDVDPLAQDISRWVVDKKNGKFVSIEGAKWNFATPLLPEHLEHD